MNHKLLIKNLLIALAAVTFLTSGLGDLQAQSASKGSSSADGYATSAMKRKERMMEAEIDKAAKAFTREEFKGIELDKAQKETLRSLVETNFEQMKSLTMQMGNMIPADKAKKLKSTYKKAKKDGKGEKDAMMLSMEKIGLPEMIQEKVLTLNGSKMEITKKISMAVSDTFNEEQKAMMAEKVGMKEATETTAAETGSSKKADGSETKAEGSATKVETAGSSKK